jgi:hypothetical protein
MSALTNLKKFAEFLTTQGHSKEEMATLLSEFLGQKPPRTAPKRISHNSWTAFLAIVKERNLTLTKDEKKTTYAQWKEAKAAVWLDVLRYDQERFDKKKAEQSQTDVSGSSSSEDTEAEAEVKVADVEVKAAAPVEVKVAAAEVKQPKPHTTAEEKAAKKAKKAEKAAKKAEKAAKKAAKAAAKTETDDDEPLVVDSDNDE